MFLVKMLLADKKFFKIKLFKIGVDNQCKMRLRSVLFAILIIMKII